MHLAHRSSAPSHGALSHGAIAGIAVGATIFVALLAAGCYYLRIKCRKPPKPVIDIVYLYRTQFDGPERDVKCSLSSRSQWLGRKTRSESPESYSVAETVVRCGLSVRFPRGRNVYGGGRVVVRPDGRWNRLGDFTRLVMIPRDALGVSAPRAQRPRHGMDFELQDMQSSHHTQETRQEIFHSPESSTSTDKVKDDNKVQGPAQNEKQEHDEATLYLEMRSTRCETVIIEESDDESAVVQIHTPSTREHTAVDSSRDASPHVQSMEDPRPLPSDRSCTSMSIMAHDDSAFPNQGEQREVPRTRGLPHPLLNCMEKARKGDTIQITSLDEEPIVQRSLLEQYNGATRLDSQQIRDVSGLRNENFVNPFDLEYKPNPVIFKHLFKRFFSSRTDQEPDTPRNLDGYLCPSPCDDTAASRSVAIHVSSTGMDYVDSPSAIGGNLRKQSESLYDKLTRPIRTLRHSRRMASISEPFSSDADNHEHDSRLEPTLPKATEKERDLTPDQPSISPTDCDASPPSSSANSGASPLVVNDEPLYACAQCHRKFRTPGQRREHENRKHIRRFGCPQCAKTFNLGADLKRHQITVHKLQADRSSSAQAQLRCSNIGCKSAGKVWDRKDNFARHLERCRKTSRRTAAAMKANS